MSSFTFFYIPLTLYIYIYIYYFYLYIYFGGGFPKARATSFELWDSDGTTLLAGDVGVIVGAVYTSFSGFFIKDGVGTIQILAMARALQKCGFAFLDLGQFIVSWKECVLLSILKEMMIMTTLPNCRSSTSWLMRVFFLMMSLTLITGIQEQLGCCRGAASRILGLVPRRTRKTHP